MREIIFRGMTLDGKWVEGCYQKLVIHGIMRHFILPANSLVFDNIKLIDSLIEVLPETVGEFTGLQDQGKDIYEGDIIHDLHYVGRGKRKHYYVVEFNDGSFGMRNISSQRFTSFKDFPFTSEVIIGNIHDNPKLLKTK